MSAHLSIRPHPGRVRAEHASLADYLTGVLSPDQLARPLLVSFTQWDFAVAAVGETALTLADMGCDVSVALWSEETPLPDVGWQVDHRIARLLGSPTIDQRLRKGLRSAGLPGEVFLDVKRPWRPAALLPRISDTGRSSIRALTYRGAPLGRGILEVPPIPDVPVTDEFKWPRSYVERAAESYAFVYDQTLRVIDERQITAVFAYNGRFLHDSAVAAAAEARGLPVLAYDTGGLETDFDLTIDATHDWSALQTRMKTMYASWPAEERDVLGGSWFEDRMAHTESANAKFTGAQQLGHGIERSPDEVVVTYFSSSGDEIAELDLDWSEYFEGQPGALRRVADCCRELGYRLVVRTHPHKRFKSRQDVAEWHQAVDEANVDLHLDEYSDVDSYTLMRQSDVVITYGSSTGVEAGYCERPVIVMGPSAYDELGCAVRVRSVDELRQALMNRCAGTRTHAIPYGLMMKRRGFSYAYLRVDEQGRRTCAGVLIVEPRVLARHLSHVLQRFRRNRFLGQG